ncbi:MAG: hypothetical protein AAGA43_07330 [Bacteroidota bacterium]
MKKTLAVLIGIFSLLGYSFRMYKPSKDIDTNILGVWRSIEDAHSELKFRKNGKCHFYYYGRQSDTFKYRISHTNPSCDKNIRLDPSFRHLRLENVLDENETYCYELVKLDSLHLEIRLLDRAKVMKYRKKSP